MFGQTNNQSGNQQSAFVFKEPLPVNRQPGTNQPATFGFNSNAGVSTGTNGFGLGNNQPSSSFNFGSSQPATSQAPKPFSFGTSQPATAQPSNTFSFGTSQPATAQPSNTFSFGTSQPATAQPSNAFSFGTSQPAASQPSNAFSFGTSQPAASQPSNAFSFTAPTDNNLGSKRTNSQASSNFSLSASQSSAPASSSAFSFGTSQPATSTSTSFGFGTSQPTSAPTTSSAFSFGTSQPTSAPSTSTAFSFGTSQPTSAPSTSTAFSFGTSQPTTSSSFGTSAAPTSFGFGTSQAATPKPTFGTSTTFGTSQTTPSSAATGNSLFGANTALQPNNTTNPAFDYLDIQRCFPDNNMSSYIVKQDSITRSTDLVNQLFGSHTVHTSSQQSYPKKLDKATTLSRESSDLEVNQKYVLLPPYLSAGAYCNPLVFNQKTNGSSLNRKKRILEEESSTGRAKIQKGIFGQSNSLTEGFDKNLKKLEDSTRIPTQSMHDIGFVPTSYKTKDRQSTESLLPKTELFKKQREQPTDNKTKVRVFGYDDNKLQDVILFFSKLGEVSEPYVVQGNWVTFTYCTPEAANKALSYNGVNIDTNHVVGVVRDEKAKEIELVKTNEPIDLFKKKPSSTSAPQLRPLPLSQEQKNSFFYRLREKFMAW